MLRRDRTLVEILFTIDCESQWSRTIRHFVDTATDVCCVECKGCTLIMIAHAVLYISHRKLTVRDNPQRHVLCILILTQSPRQIAVKSISIVIEEAPNTCIAETTTREVWECVCILPREVRILTIEPSHLTSVRDYVLRVKHVFLVLHIELADTALVCMSANCIIGYAQSYPNNTFRTSTCTLHLHNPSLVGVADRESLTF